MGIPAQRPWTLDARRLRSWFLAYVILWGLGITAAVARLEIGKYIFLVCIVPYVPCIVYAYRTQKRLNAAGLYGAGAWQVIAGAILLNPYLLGFYVPASVLWRSRRITRTILTSPTPGSEPAPKP